MVQRGVAGIVFAQQILGTPDLSRNIVQSAVARGSMKEGIAGGVGLHELRTVKRL